MIGSAEVVQRQLVALTTATVTGANTIHALASRHLRDNNVPALLKSFSNASGIIESDGSIVPRSGSDGWDGKVVSVDKDRTSISE